MDTVLVLGLLGVAAWCKEAHGVLTGREDASIRDLLKLTPVGVLGVVCVVIQLRNDN